MRDDRKGKKTKSDPNWNHTQKPIPDGVKIEEKEKRKPRELDN